MRDRRGGKCATLIGLFEAGRDGLILAGGILSS
jgi:hypothetical protein